MVASGPAAGSLVERVARLYGEEVGEESLSRQRELAKTRYVCCGEPKGGPHHAACHNFVEPDAPAVIEGQESLL